jgi:hypothetical protein
MRFGLFSAAQITWKKLRLLALNFRILNQGMNTEIYAGQVIEYRLKPLFGIPVYWMTELHRLKTKFILLMNNISVLIHYGIINIILKR